MAKKKYYAVKIGTKTGIYETWAECELQVKAVSGAEYRAFTSLSDAEAYIARTNTERHREKDYNNENAVDDINKQIDEELRNLKTGEVIAFVDGSFNSIEEKSGFGVIIIDDKGIETPLYKAFTKKLNPEFVELRNVAAELEGVKEAVNWAIKYNKSRIKIYYDYEGIGSWVDGSWSAKNNITKRYVDFIKAKKALIEMEFCRVSAHSGILYNEQADKLAKNSLLEKGYKTHNDGSIYFVGFSTDDWETIVDCINEEDAGLIECKQDIIRINKEKTGQCHRMVITDSKNRVIINCYSNCNSYVQGKQSVLFQKIISSAVGFMKNGQTVIEILNRVHVLTLTKDEVELKFEQLLPHYSGKRSEKHYNNLLSAVYNTMLIGYMPDYTSLVTPIFRAYEYFLHKILSDVMNLNTCRDNGTNNFAFFDKKANGKYECNATNISVLTDEQIVYLNDLYSAYRETRHKYSHWSADDYDTAVVATIEDACEYAEFYN